MELSRQDFHDFTVFIDPESVFWALSWESDIPEEVKKVWLENRDRLVDELAKYRH